MAQDRMRRIDEAMREVLSDAILSDLHSPQIGFVTITRVRTSSDLRHAKVYVSVFGSESEREQSVSALQESAVYLQSCVAGQLRMKRTPTLLFLEDDGVREGARITALIDEEAKKL